MLFLLLLVVHLLLLLRYKERVLDCLRKNARNPLKPTVLSMIIDGMDQEHGRVPYLGTQNAFSSPLKQSITGVKEHGVGFTVYRTMNTVKKGANLTIHCISSQIEAWYQRNGYYPEEIHLQLDGGCENANQHVLAYLESLIAKRVCRLIFYSRLPTGHTMRTLTRVSRSFG